MRPIRVVYPPQVMNQPHLADILSAVDVLPIEQQKELLQYLVGKVGMPVQVISKNTADVIVQIFTPTDNPHEQVKEAIDLHKELTHRPHQESYQERFD